EQRQQRGAGNRLGVAQAHRQSPMIAIASAEYSTATALNPHSSRLAKPRNRLRSPALGPSWGTAALPRRCARQPRQPNPAITTRATAVSTQSALRASPSEATRDIFAHHTAAST